MPANCKNCIWTLSVTDKTLFLDLGNVLFFFDFNRTLDALAADTGGSRQSIMARCRPSLRAFSAGGLTGEAFFQAVCRSLEAPLDRARFQRQFNDIFVPNPDMLDSLPVFAGQARLFLLSDTNRWHMDFLKPRYPEVFAWFSGEVLSHEVRLKKPDPRFYQAALDLSGRPPHTTLYLDDLQENVAAAASLGISAERYTPALSPNRIQALLKNLPAG